MDLNKIQIALEFLENQLSRRYCKDDMKKLEIRRKKLMQLKEWSSNGN